MDGKEARLNVSIGNEELDFSDYTVPEDEATGKELLLAYGAEDLDKHTVFQWLDGRGTFRLGVDDYAKPDRRKPLRFLVFDGNERFEFELDGIEFEWGAGRIMGRVLKGLVDLDPNTYAVWRENEKGEDDEIGNDDWSTLDQVSAVTYFTGRQETTEGEKPV